MNKILQDNLPRRKDCSCGYLFYLLFGRIKGPYTCCLGGHYLFAFYFVGASKEKYLKICPSSLADNKFYCSVVEKLNVMGPTWFLYIIGFSTWSFFPIKSPHRLLEYSHLKIWKKGIKFMFPNRKHEFFNILFTP